MFVFLLSKQFFEEFFISLHEQQQFFVNFPVFRFSKTSQEIHIHCHLSSTILPSICCSLFLITMIDDFNYIRLIILPPLSQTSKMNKHPFRSLKSHQTFSIKHFFMTLHYHHYECKSICFPFYWVFIFPQTFILPFLLFFFVIQFVESWKQTDREASWQLSGSQLTNVEWIFLSLFFLSVTGNSSRPSCFCWER